MDTLLDRYYYFVTEHSSGKVSFEGYLSPENAQKYAEQRRKDYEAQGKPFEAEHTTYVGDTLPEKVLELAITAMEKDFQMPALTGSDKQIAWARAIRYRYGRYLSNRYSEQRGYELFRERGQEKQASWWIENRYGLAAANKDSRYVADGVQEG